jgi:cysteine desulfurase
MTDETIYLDHAATTPVDARVLEIMLPFFTERFGNPSSVYQLGQEGRAALDRSRSTVARVLECQPGEVLFTSGATESNNLALGGVAWKRRLTDPEGVPRHIVTTTIEHHAVLHTARWLEQTGFDVTYVGCGRDGIVSPDDVLAALRPETCLVSVMYANNEVGAVQPIAEIGVRLRERDALFHVDATQAAGFLPLRVEELNVDLLSLSAHKFYGPKGVGVLYVRKQTPIAYQQHGGGQEGGRRGGTENVPGIVGFSAALDLAEATRERYAAHCRRLRARMLDGVLARIDGVELNGPSDPERRLPNNLNVRIEGIQGETALLSLDMQGVAASAGSACTTGNSEPSHVLLAMGLTEQDARTSLRFSVGRANTAEQIDEAIDILAETVARIRELSSVTAAH